VSVTSDIFVHKPVLNNESTFCKILSVSNVGVITM